MSTLDSIKNKKDKKVKVYLKGVHFDFESDENNLGPHIHYTNGAASLLDEPYLLKSKDKSPTKEEEKILSKFVNKKIKLKEDIMDEDVKKEMEEKDNKIQELEKKLSEGEIKKGIESFNFKEELSDELVKTLLILDKDNREVILKAFNDIVSTKDEEISKIKETKTDDGDESLKKQLDDEAGHDGEAEIEKEETFLDRVKKSQEDLNKKKGDK